MFFMAFFDKKARREMMGRTIEFRHGSKIEPIQVAVPNTPEIQRQKEYVEHMRSRLAMAEQELKKMIEEFQRICPHDYEKIMRFDEEYCGRVDDQGRGQNVYMGKICKKCGLFEPRPKGHPWQICHKCGGRMRHDHQELYGQDRVNIHKCQACGHEYDTT